MWIKVTFCRLNLNFTWSNSRHMWCMQQLVWNEQLLACKSFPQAKRSEWVVFKTLWVIVDLICFFAFKGAHVESKWDSWNAVLDRNPAFTFSFSTLFYEWSKWKSPNSWRSAPSIVANSVPYTWRAFIEHTVLFIWQDTYLSNSRQMFCPTCIPFFPVLPQWWLCAFQNKVLHGVRQWPTLFQREWGDWMTGWGYLQGE